MNDYQDIYNLIEEKVNEAYNRGFGQGRAHVISEEPIKLKKEYQKGYDKGDKEGYHEGLNEAWEYVGKIERLLFEDADKIPEVFGCSDFYSVITKMSPYEAIEKYRKYEENLETQKTESEAVIEFKEKLKSGLLQVGDELVTTDIDGEATFVVAHLKDGKAYMVRKWLLDNSEERPLIDDEFNVFNWLNNEYRESLPEDIREMIVGDVTLPSEKEVFGENKYGEKEDGEQFEWFKTVTNRVTAYSQDDEYTRWWWTRTKHVSASAFAAVYVTGAANYIAPSTTWDGLRPHVILAAI